MKKILLAEDDQDLREVIAEILATEGYSVTTAINGEDALDKLKLKSFDLILSDIQMPGLNGCELLDQAQQAYIDAPFLLMTAYGTIEQAVDSMRNGAKDYLVKPFEEDALLSAVKKHISAFTEESSHAVMVDVKSKNLFTLAKRVANSNVSVLISGESGAGKEVLARYIHQNSPRHEGPFVAINCAAIPENMLEAVLFGYEKGAFTGAYQRTAGKFELAQGGTLLLDEISEMDLALQAKLLRVLQEREVERIGSQKTIKLDVRVLATTNRKLREQVQSGQFREDLFYRLNVFPLSVPALGQRKEDIVPLANAMIMKHKPAEESGEILISNAAVAKMSRYHWPGNIRELENVIQRALVICRNNIIEAEDLILESALESELETNSIAEKDEQVLCNDLKRHEQELILQALRKGNGSRKYAAETLGISPRTLRYKLSRMRDQGVQIPDARGVISAA